MTATSADNGKWTEIKRDIKKVWNKLTDHDLEQTKGDRNRVSTLLNEKYSDTRDTHASRLDEIYGRFENNKDIYPQ